MIFADWGSVYLAAGPFTVADWGCYFYAQNESIEPSKQLMFAFKWVPKIFLPFPPLLNPTIFLIPPK